MTSARTERRANESSLTNRPEAVPHPLWPPTTRIPTVPGWSRATVPIPGGHGGTTSRASFLRVLVSRRAQASSSGALCRRCPRGFGVRLVELTDQVRTARRVHGRITLLLLLLLIITRECGRTWSGRAVKNYFFDLTFLTLLHVCWCVALAGLHGGRSLRMGFADGQYENDVIGFWSLARENAKKILSKCISNCFVYRTFHLYR